MDQIICYKNEKLGRLNLTKIFLSIKSEEEMLAELSNSLWRSPGGSLYKYTNGEFLCITVHSPNYRGWINKVAIRNTRRVETGWYGEQAFRNGFSGDLFRWETIELIVMEHKIIKLFPRHIPREILVYGYTEEYTRVYDH